tara:strand:+ start:5062 stop:6687 length:1626 start_codon:yes stop_codon:yes gene_type:complete
MKKTSSTILFLLIILISSCVKDITETLDKASKVNQVRWNPKIAIPLVYSDLSFRDLLDGTNANQYIRIDDDSLVNLVYEDDYTSDYAEDVLNLETQSYGETFTFNSTQLEVLNTVGEVTVNFSQRVSYDGNANELDKIWFKAGQIGLNLSSTFEHNISCKLVIPESQKNSSPILLSLAAPYSGNPIDASTNYDLSNSEIDFTKTAQGHSEFDFNFEFTITKTGSNPVKPSESITYSMILDNQKFSKVSGYFTDLDFEDLTGTFSIPFFENSKNGIIGIVEPEIKFITGNGIGLPIDLSFDQFDGKDNFDNIVPLTKNAGNIELNIPRANVEGEFVLDSQVLDNSNSNLIDYISNRPINNYYKVSVRPNLSNASRHWLLDTSRISSQIKITLPLYGTLKDYLLEETRPFDLSLENAEEIKEVLVRLYSENGFPVDVKTQLYFEDSLTNTIIDSLFISDRVISKAASVDSDGNPIGVSSQITDVFMDADRVDKVIGANQIRAQAHLSTTTSNIGAQPNVRIFSDDKIMLQFGVQAEVLINQEL